MWQRLGRRSGGKGKMAPVITYFIIICFLCKKKKQQPDSNGFIHQLIKEVGEMSQVH